jgi:hypothetical protein
MLHMLGIHCHNTARAFPRGPLHGYTRPWLHIMIQFRTRVFPTARRRLAHIHAMPKRCLRHCHACGGDVHEHIEHIMLELSLYILDKWTYIYF